MTRSDDPARAHPWRTLTQQLADLEREDPAVAAASRAVDDTIDRLNYAADLHAFRPLPWDRRVTG